MLQLQPFILPQLLSNFAQRTADIIARTPDHVIRNRHKIQARKQNRFHISMLQAFASSCQMPNYYVYAAGIFPLRPDILAQERALPVGPEEGRLGMSYDLLYGHVGFLWAALFINKHIGQETLPSDLLRPIVKAVLAGGRAGASGNTACHLFYRWHGTRYYGAAHGLAGILHVLLHFQLSQEDAEDVKMALRYMMSKRFLHSGNYPSSEGNPRDSLVQWSHGATGMAITLCKASEVFPCDRELRDAAMEAGEVVWTRGLVEKAGLADVCLGVSIPSFRSIDLQEKVFMKRGLGYLLASCIIMQENLQLEILVDETTPTPFSTGLLGLLAYGLICLHQQRPGSRVMKSKVLKWRYAQAWFNAKRMSVPAEAFHCDLYNHN